MSKNRSGEHIEIDWDLTDPPWEIVRGHVDAETFAAALLKHGYNDVPSGKLEHLYARANPDPTGEYVCRYVLCEPQRGAFKVTIRRWDWRR